MSARLIAAAKAAAAHIQSEENASAFQQPTWIRLAEELEAAVAESVWTPVSTRLPETGQCVLLTIRHIPQLPESEEVILAIIDNGGIWFEATSEMDEIPPMDAFAWMPLPEPYRP